MAKDIYFGTDARAKLAKGVMDLAKATGETAQLGTVNKPVERIGLGCCALRCALDPCTGGVIFAVCSRKNSNQNPWFGNGNPGF